MKEKNSFIQQDVADMKDEYSRLTAECRTLTLQSTDLKAQAQVVKQSLTVTLFQ